MIEAMPMTWTSALVATAGSNHSMRRRCSGDIKSRTWERPLRTLVGGGRPSVDLEDDLALGMLMNDTLHQALEVPIDVDLNWAHVPRRGAAIPWGSHRRTTPRRASTPSASKYTTPSERILVQSLIPGSRRTADVRPSDRSAECHDARMREFVRRGVRRIVGAIDRGWERTVERSTVPRFANVPTGFEMRLPRSLLHAELMTIGDDVKLGPNSELKCNTRYPGGWMRHPQGEHVSQTFTPVLTIGNRVTATASLQIIAFESVVIEDDVMFAANVFVADGTHASETAEIPYKYQGVGTTGPVKIGRGAWIGQNAVISPGVTIGELAIVGANSVVTRDVPARTVVGGVPAQVLKRWNSERGAWERPGEGRT